MKWSYTILDGSLRFPRLIHVAHIARLAWQQRLHDGDRNLFALIFYSRYSHFVSIGRMIVSSIIGADYVACILKLLSVDVPADSASPLAGYVSNLYDALQLLKGQGVTRTTMGESLFAAMALLVDSIVLAIVFGHVAILVSNFNANSTNYQRKMESVFAIMSKLQLPAPLRERIHQYYEHLWREYESLDGEIVSFAKGLSHTLELEVVLFKYMDLIMHVPFWRSGSPDFQKQLMLHLSVRVFLPDDFIIRRGEVGDEFFMINRGVCELVLGPDSIETSTPPPLADGYENASDSHRGSSRVGLCGGRHGDVNTAARPSARGGDEGSVGRRPAYGGDGSATARTDRLDKLRALPTSRYADDAEDPVTLTRCDACASARANVRGARPAHELRAYGRREMCVLKRSDVQTIFVKHPKDRKAVITRLFDASHGAQRTQPRGLSPESSSGNCMGTRAQPPFLSNARGNDDHERNQHRARRRVHQVWHWPFVGDSSARHAAQSRRLQDKSKNCQ